MFSNRYIFIYATIMVIIVAAALSFTAQQLKPIQVENVRIEKMQNILSSAGIENTLKDVKEKYAKYITESFAVNTKGEKLNGVNAFEIDLAAEMKEKPEKMKLPVYVCHFDNGELGYIFPVHGKGLWGPIWGYICLKSDFNTVIGALFDHKGETPGLGAEIATQQFSDQFKGKSIFDAEKKFTSIKVIKGGAAPDDPHGVDAITGGTITSNGVTHMLEHSLSLYLPFISKTQSQNQ